MKIVVLDGFTLNPGDFSWEPLEQLGEVVVYDYTDSQEVAARCHGAHIILTNKVVIDRALMQRLGATLRYVGVLATGYNVVDVEAAREFGICVTNVPAYSTHSVAQMVFAHLLNVTNQVAYYSSEVCEKHRWTQSRDFCFYDKPIRELATQTMGLVGLGRIGLAVAQIAHAMGMRVQAVTSKPSSQLPPYIQKVAREQLFSTSDVISLHCPLTEDTHHIVNEASLRLMKPGVILINTGRGPLVDEQAVADSLKNQHLGYYMADVLSVEPAQANNPLFSAPRVQLTPHIAWASCEARIRLFQISVENVRKFIEGKPQNVV